MNREIAPVASLHGLRGGVRAAATPLLLAAALTATGCAAPPNPVEKDVQSIKDRSLPSGGRLIPGDSRKDNHVLRVSWEIESQMEWGEYASWLEKRLPDFRVRSRDGEALVLSRPLEGDAYSLAAKPNRGHRVPRFELTLEARPF